MADQTLLDSLNQQKAELESQAQDQIQSYLNAKTDLTGLLNNNGTEEEIAGADLAVSNAKALVDETKDQIKMVDQQIVAATDEPVTNMSESDIEAELRQQNSEVVGENTFPSLSTIASSAVSGIKSAIGTATGLFGKALFGAIPPKISAASVTFKNVQGDVISEDLRVKIRVPQEYWSDITAGPNGELFNLSGIIFPYTPTINYEYKADYANLNPLHSNFSLYFYKNSSVSPIKISGKFTVQNDKDAAVYLSTIHLLRALTKMRSGGIKVDALSGSPPPICRLDAYGDLMLKNVPVVITGFNIDLPDNVDYFTVNKTGGSVPSAYGVASVPIISTISVTCTPMYSRAEMQKFNVNDFVNNINSKKSGYL